MDNPVLEGTAEIATVPRQGATQAASSLQPKCLFPPEEGLLEAPDLKAPPQTEKGKRK